MPWRLVLAVGGCAKRSKSASGRCTSSHRRKPVNSEPTNQPPLVNRQPSWDDFGLHERRPPPSLPMLDISVRAVVLVLVCLICASSHVAYGLTMMTKDGLSSSSVRSRPRHHSIFHRIRRSSPPPTIEPPRIISILDDVPERDVHRKMMGYALEEARVAGQMGEVPIGAIVVRELHQGETALSSGNRQSQNTTNTNTRQFELISTGRNLVETNTDASAHAELEAMKKAASRVGNWRLLNATLYSTLEPCPMCLAAAQAFRCKSVVYGAPDMRLGAVETHIRLLDNKHPYHDVEAIGGVLAEESAAMLRDFFRRRRTQGRKKASEFGCGNSGAVQVQNGNTRRTIRSTVLGRIFPFFKRIFSNRRRGQG